MLVISNGNGGSGEGSLSVARVNPNGQLTRLGGPQVVPGSGDLTNVHVVENGVRVFVYVSDPLNNQIFAFRLGPTGVLTQVGPPAAGFGGEPRGLDSAGNLLLVVNASTLDVSFFAIRPDGSLEQAVPNAPLEGAENPRY